MSPENEAYLINLIEEQQKDQRDLHVKLEEVSKQLAVICATSISCRSTVQKHEKILSGNGDEGLVTKAFASEASSKSHRERLDRIDETLNTWRKLLFTTLTTAIFTLISSAVSLSFLIF